MCGNVQILRMQLGKVIHVLYSLSQTPTCISCHAIYTCMFLNSCVHTMDGAPCTGLHSLSLSMSYLCLEQCRLESKGKVHSVNGIIGLSHAQPSLFHCKRFDTMLDTPVPSKR